MRLSDIAAVVGGTVAEDTEFTGIEIDSRKVAPGDLFVCLKGERVDGHDYAKKAAEAGASCLLCEHETDAGVPQLVVPDCVAALQAFAASYRRSLDILMVGVTGSVGKTSTKECIACVLNRKFKTHKTPGNMNSETGLPRTILGITSDHRAAVTEMGMCNLGEISVLTKIARPDVAVITNIGVSHLENLKTRENILKAKLEILEGLAQNGLLVYNGDDEYLRSAKDVISSVRSVSYGFGEDCDVRADSVESGDGKLSFRVITPECAFGVTMPCEGEHNVRNALAAVCVGREAGIPYDEIAIGLGEFSSVPMRQQHYTKDGFRIIEDCYNAGPESMTAALNILRVKPGRRIAVLGDMLELGSISDEMHRKIGSQTKGLDEVVFFGSHASCFAEGALGAGVEKERVHLCENAQTAGKLLKKLAYEGDCILVKASRGMHGEYALEAFFAK